LNKGLERPDGVLASPFVRLLIGLVLVLGVVVIGQSAVTALPLSKLWKNVFLGLLTPLLTLGTYYGIVWFTERRRALEIGGSGAIREIFFGALVGALLFCLTVAILAVLGVYRVTGTNPWGVLLLPFIGAVTSAVIEETLFRGVLFRLVEEGLGSWLALVISGAIFGGLHLLNTNATWQGAAAVTFEAGILLAAAFMLTRRLWFAMGLHFAWNFTQSGIFGIAVSGNEALQGILKSSVSGPEWLTGGTFGVEASVVAVALGVAAGILILILAGRAGKLVRAPWKRT